MFKMQLLLIFVIMLVSIEDIDFQTQADAVDIKEPDQLALMAIKSKIVNDPEGVLSSWNNSLHFCQWEGVICGRRHRRVTSLELYSRGLTGSLSPFVGNLSFLRVLRLSNNTLHGVIPTEIGRLFRLERLGLTNNSFEGNVPASLQNCTNLSRLGLSYNKLTGTILREVSSLPNLKNLSIYANDFTEEIPSSIGNLTSLELLSADTNHFGGSIPDAIGQLKKLSFMDIATNQLIGTIPSSLYNLSLLSVLSIADNQLVGSLPPDIGLKLPKLRWLNIFRNQFMGLLPVSISNCSESEVINVAENNFHGKIVLDFGMMPNLAKLSLAENYFGSGEADEFNFISYLGNCSNLNKFVIFGNQIRGQLPSSIGNLSTQLSVLGLERNFIYGSIPPSVMNLVRLEILGLNHNQFQSTIPSNLGNLGKVQYLYLEENSLTGIIPESIGNMSLLNEVHLQNNKLEGIIPTTFGNCRNLGLLNISLNNLTGSLPKELLGLSSLSISLNLASNQFSGSLPQEIGKLHNLMELDLSENHLVGEVPSSIGSCTSLEYLYLEGNFFQGSIPPSFGSLTGIQNLDLSRNNFSGQIPRFLENFSLKNLNLSFNNFEGEMPMNGSFKNATAISIEGNNRLCGGMPEFHLPKCDMKEAKKSKKMPLPFIIVIPTGLIILLVGLALASHRLLIRHKRRSKMQPTGQFLEQPFTMYSYEMLLKVTNGFSSENLIGMGSFSRVYKGVLEEDGVSIAVKVLNLDLFGALKSFMAECEAWRNIRHRNLVKIISVCSSVDYHGNDFKALVYEFMPNGSLESWLHEITGMQNRGIEVHGLPLLQRINIATDIAHAVDYLHNRCEFSIIHCDIKPSNILLDIDMVAHVGDFGLARFLVPEASSFSQSSSIGLKGTIGYAPPEYGLGSEMSTQGDVYSFGIVLLEMMTGKRPTNNMFQNGLNLHIYARKALQDCIMDIVDPILVNEEEQERRNPSYAKQRVETMVSVIKIGIGCSMESAQDRMNISEVVNELQRITNIISKQEITVARRESMEEQVKGVSK